METNTGVVPKDFPQFLRLPLELQMTIWELAVRGQDRLVRTNLLRKVTYAPCPVLFLVCRRSKQSTEKFYQRLIGNHLLNCRLQPSVVRYPGPILSFENDIIHIGLWNEWSAIGPCTPSRYDFSRTPLSPICRRINEFSKNKIRRIAVLDTKYYRDRAQRIYHRASYRAQRLVTSEPDWLYLWAQNVEEVWITSRGRSMRIYLTSSRKASREKQRPFNVPILREPRRIVTRSHARSLPRVKKLHKAKSF
ncbi:hypothetical protein F5B20DRAFT_565593 [Whalleya microplaca]|nr:hypothetical protein F5B20DRAFT_565593 [Whalleya microplaca]